MSRQVGLQRNRGSESRSADIERTIDMPERFAHLGEFSDLVALLEGKRPFCPIADPGPETQQRVRESLSFSEPDDAPSDVQVLKRWEHEGVAGEVVTWTVGFGPRTEAWLLRPAGTTDPLPGIVALHDHGGFKFFGKEKIADGPGGEESGVVNIRLKLYEGRAFVNELVRRGFVVLVHDVFLWGSRRFPMDVMPERIHQLVAQTGGPETERYNEAARFHEHLVAKYAALLGTTITGIVSAEDRVAVRYLQSRPDVQAQRVGCMGLSGGGCRAALLQATCNDIRATVIVGMMCTYRALLDHYIDPNTWMFLPNGWSQYGDWPDLAACRAPSPLLVQYLNHDHLFTLEGMQAADARLATHYASVGHPENYDGEFYDGPHRFSVEMQNVAFDWLVRQLQA